MKIIDLNGNERDCVKAYPDKEYPGYMRVEFKNKTRSHHEWYSMDEFVKNNPGLKHLCLSAPKTAEETLGIVTNSKPIELTDKKQNWAIDSYVGFPVWISRGRGEGQLRTIIANTQDTVKIDKKWTILPNTTSQYVISRNIHDPNVLGNMLPQNTKP